jgi:pilus assembly protein CpaD
MSIRMKRPLANAVALSLGLTLAACGGVPNNRGLESVKQPVVERQNYTLDLNTGAGGLSIPEQRRLADWFDTLDLKYGDRISIDDPLSSGATREAVAAIAARHGLLISDGAPVTEGFVDPGAARVVVTRSRAYVPGCPDWSGQMTSTLNNETNNGFGCAVNSNLAAMIADPEHLLHGATGTGETVVMSASKAIDSYREQAPTGQKGLSQTSSQSAGGGAN